MKKTTARFMFWMILFVPLLFGMSAPVFAAENEAYVFAVIPSAPPVDIHTLWQPFIERLSRDTGIGLRLKVYEKMSAFEGDISAGGPDFIFASPLQAVVAHKAHGYTPLIRGSSPVSSLIFVRKGSPIMTVDDLSGKKISFAGNKSL